MKSKDLLAKESNDQQGRSKKRGGKTSTIEEQGPRAVNMSNNAAKTRNVTSRGIGRSSKPTLKKKRSIKILLQLELQQKTRHNFFQFFR